MWLAGVFGCLKVKGQEGTIAVRKTPAEYKEKKKIIEVKHWNRSCVGGLGTFLFGDFHDLTGQIPQQPFHQ